VDHDRVRRRGFPEAIFCPGKSVEQIVAIARSFEEQATENVLVTRATPEALAALDTEFPSVQVRPEARLAVLNPSLSAPVGMVAVVAWRPADLPVAEEATWTARAMGSAVTAAFDAPVEHPETFPAWATQLAEANVVVAVDGTGTGLWSLVAGVSTAPVIALPSSAGHDLGGLPALLSAVNSCVPGVLTVNIDNGFGAGYAAHEINERIATAERRAPAAAPASAPRAVIEATARR
jgi:NCAIR mutase (PurE)-related protein